MPKKLPDELRKRRTVKNPKLIKELPAVTQSAMANSAMANSAVTNSHELTIGEGTSLITSPEPLHGLSEDTLHLFQRIDPEVTFKGWGYQQIEIFKVFLTNFAINPVKALRETTRSCKQVNYNLITTWYKDLDWENLASMECIRMSENNMPTKLIIEKIEVGRNKLADIVNSSLDTFMESLPILKQNLATSIAEATDSKSINNTFSTLERNAKIICGLEEKKAPEFTANMGIHIEGLD